MTGIITKISIFLEMIKFSHTIFALPFALTGALLAAGGFPSVRQTVWIILAMVGARTAAMAMNRLIDAEIDARNPRTAVRAIPAGHDQPGADTVFHCCGNRPDAACRADAEPALPQTLADRPLFPAALFLLQTLHRAGPCRARHLSGSGADRCLGGDSRHD